MLWLHTVVTCCGLMPWLHAGVTWTTTCDHCMQSLWKHALAYNLCMKHLHWHAIPTYNFYMQPLCNTPAYNPYIQPLHTTPACNLCMQLLHATTLYNHCTFIACTTVCDHRCDHSM